MHTHTQLLSVHLFFPVHVPALYNDVRSTTNGPVSPYEIPLDTLNKQPLSSIEEVSSYEIPAQTLKKTTREPAFIINRNNSSVYETVFNDKHEDCTADLPVSTIILNLLYCLIYMNFITAEYIETFSEIDNHGDKANVSSKSQSKLLTCPKLC